MNRAPAEPEWKYEAEAIQRILTRKGIGDPEAKIPNPRFDELFQAEKAAEAANSKQYHYQMPSDEVIRARVARSYSNVPMTVRAGDAISKAEIELEKANILREHPQKKSASTTSPTGNRAQMVADESFYQEKYSVMRPEHRAAYEQDFKRRYGRLPRKQ